MRGRELAAGAMWVWLSGNPHKGDGFHASRAVPLPFPTQDTGEVIRAACFLAKAMMQPDQAYKRAGVGLTDLVQAAMRQEDLFFGADKRREKNMLVIDAINSKYGRGTMGVGRAGWRIGGVRPGRGKPADQWRPTLKSLSPE